VIESFTSFVEVNGTGTVDLGCKLDGGITDRDSSIRWEHDVFDCKVRFHIVLIEEIYCDWVSWIDFVAFASVLITYV